MWIGQTTRSPLTAIERNWTGSSSNSSGRYTAAETGRTDGNGWTIGATAGYSETNTLFSLTGSGGSTTGATHDSTDGATYTSTGSYTQIGTGTIPTSGTGSFSGTTAGTFGYTTLTTGVSTSTITNKAGTVSTARSRTYTYPKSTVATSTRVSTQTAETAATQNTTLYGSTTTTTRASGTYTQTTSTAGFITDTSRIAATTQITRAPLTSNFDVIDTAYWLNDDERGWSYTGGAGIRPLNSICSEASGSFTTTASTTTVARTRSVVAASASTITLSHMGTAYTALTVTWTNSAPTNVTETLLSLTDIPNSTSTLANIADLTTTQNTYNTVGSYSYETTSTSLVYASETYVLFDAYFASLATQITEAFNDSGDVTGFTTRGTGGERFPAGTHRGQVTSSTVASSSAPVALSGATSTEGISETITAIAEWTGLRAYNQNEPIVYKPWVPSGVRVYESFQQKSIYAQIGASGLGFTVPFEAFSIFQRDSVLSPMDTTYTTTDESAGNTRSYTVSVGTSATNDTANFIFVTRATESTTETSTSAALYNTHELTRRARFPDSLYKDSQWVMGGRQCDTRLEIAAFEEGVLDYTVVDTTTTHAGILTTQASYTTSAASSSLIAFRSIPGYSEAQRGEGYSTTPKWITP